MIGSHLIALALPLLGSGATVDVAAATVTELEAGRRPVQFDEPSRPAADLVSSLPLGVRVLSRRTDFRFVYTPRLQLQIPNAASTYRPLQMHQLASVYSSELSRRTQIRAAVLGAAGETSYSSVQEYFEPGTSDGRRRFASLITANGSVGTSTRTSPRNSVGWLLAGGYRGPLDREQSLEADGGATNRNLRTSYDTTLTLQDTYILSPQDGLVFSVYSGYLGIIDNANPLSQDQIGTGGDVSWMHRLSPRADFTLTGGAILVYGTSAKTFDLAPTALGTHSVSFLGAGGRWTATTSLGVRSFIDRVSATYRSRASGRFNLVGRFGRSWIFSVYADGSTALADEPIQPATYESRAGVGQTTSYLFSRRGNVNWGVRGGLRAPHLSQWDALAPQNELTAFVGFRWNIGTDREHGSWL